MLKSRLNGNLIVDFGNPMLVFLMAQHKSVCKAIKNGTMTATKDMGFLGIPFFNSAVAFDFDNGRMFVL